MSRPGILSGLSAILPCHEESAGLPQLLQQVDQALHRLGIASSEVILVCDLAARDGTPVLARSLLARGWIPGLRLVEQAAGDPGYGRALTLGLSRAQHGWAWLLDADGQFDPFELPRLAALATSEAAVLGFRDRRQDGWPRRLSGACYSRILSRVLCLGPLRDLDCAFKLVPLAPLREPPLACRTGVVNAEIALRLLDAGVSLRQTPVAHFPRRTGSSRFGRRIALLGEVPRFETTAAIVQEAWRLALARTFP